jgi:superfamily I DNA/RNA helicase
VTWPPGLDEALRTRGFAREVRAVLARARELGLEPEDLVRLGRSADRPEWAAAGVFMEQYLDVLGFEGAIDYSELVHQAVLLAETPEVRADLRAAYSAVFVDEYQDTDPAQVELLELLAGGGGNLVAVGDPDQAIYAFRGADPRGIVRFPDRFLTTTGRPAPRVSLGVCRRSGAELLRISRAVADGLPGPWEHRRLAAVEGAAPGEAAVHVFGSAALEAAYLADVLRRAHLLEGLRWSEMAVVVRSATALGPLRRALAQAGVPVAVAADDLALAAQPRSEERVLACV